MGRECEKKNMRAGFQSRIGRITFGAKRKTTLIGSSSLDAWMLLDVIMQIKEVCI